jgi:CubicO group peptidase (beta-lactamase class C family)
MVEAAFLPATTPEAQGIRSGAIAAFVDDVERDIRDLNSFILVRHGAVVAEAYWEPYGAEYPHVLFSLSKSFTSTAIGLLVADGRLSVDDRVLDFFPDESPTQPDGFLGALRVRHLLTMTTGHDVEPTSSRRSAPQADQPTWAQSFLAAPLTHQPGTHFVYNSLATYMLSAIVQRITGERLVQYLEPRLFAPLGITGATWETSPQGINTGGWGLNVKTRDIARFGQLYLQRGVWQGKRLLPEAWIDEATSWQVPNGPNVNPDWEQGYGYQFWRSRHGAYRGDGAFGQFCVVMPDQDAVLAVTSGVSNMQAVLDLVWKHLLPAMGATALPEGSAARTALSDPLAGLRLAPAAGTPTSPLSAEISGREFELADNAEGLRSIALAFASDGATLRIRDADGAQPIACGYGRWVRNEIRPMGEGMAVSGSTWPSKVAASGAWLDERTYIVDLCWYESPFRRTLTCRFEGDRVVVDHAVNVSFGPTELPRLEGRAVARSRTDG